MFDSKFIVTLIALIISVVAICNFDKKKGDSTENFGMLPSQVLKPTYVYKDPKSGNFVSVPNMSTTIAPRFGNTNLGASIKYSLPDGKNMAFDSQKPVVGGAFVGTYPSSQIQENFTTPSCSFLSNPVMKPDFSSGNFNKMQQKSQTQSGSQEMAEQVPIGSMKTTDTNGEQIETVVFSRFQVANRSNSRLRAAGDPIRGDVTPMAVTGVDSAWIPSINATSDLHMGALAVMGGLNGEQASSMGSFMYGNSLQTAVGGIDMSTENLSSIGMLNSDVSVMAGA